MEKEEMEEMIASRTHLAEAVEMLYTESPAWSEAQRRYSDAILAMADYDAAHPEVLEEIRRRRRIAHPVTESQMWG